MREASSVVVQFRVCGVGLLVRTPPSLAKKLGVEVTFVGVPVVDHKIFMVAKAQNFEAVRSLIVQSGIMQPNTAHIYPTVSFDEAMKMVGTLPPIF